MSQYLGDISAYALAVSQGYTGTEEEYAELMASYATVGQTAVTAAQTATTKASEAATSATTATNKASEATTAATTATTKAGEASTSASTATSAKDTAVSASQTATTKATEATTAAAAATSAKTDAVAANTAAQSAKTAAQTAQTGAETAAASVSASAAQIQTNADDISELKEDLTAVSNWVGYDDGIRETELTFQNGWINTTTGNITTNSTRCITEKQLVKTGEKLVINRIDDSKTRYIAYAYYDQNGTYTGYDSWVSWNPADPSQIELTYSDNRYVAVGIRYADNANIDPADTNCNVIFVTSETVEPIADKVDGMIDDVDDLCKSTSKKFYATYEATELPQTITSTITARLSLIATKKDNGVLERNPQDIGYLYADEKSNPQKMYYSANRYDRPVYLCDWKKSVAEGESIGRWCPIITKDGDIIFLYQGKQNTRTNPIVYPHGDYSNPVRLNLSPADGVLPSGLTTDTGACASFSGDFVLWGEYNRSGKAALEGYPMRIWKVSKPYINAENWKVVLTKYYTTTEPAVVGDNITHWHTVAYDHYANRYYANTGDFSKSCQVYESADDGETWTMVASDGQMWRTLGYVFTDNGCYWGTDSSQVSKHNLYYAERDVNGVVDFSTTRILAECKYDAIDGVTNLQRTYNTCLCRNPDGILLLDRAEERYDGKLNLEFYSFDDNKMHLVDVLHKLPDYTTRYGFGNYAVTYYQSTEEDGIICGGMNYDRVMSLDMLNNNINNMLGVTKITIHRINN